MTKPLSPSAPQFKTAIVRRLKNVAPEHAVEFVEADRGVAFRLKDRQGRCRSRLVQIYRNDGHALDRQRIEGLLKSAGFPAVFQS